MDEGGPSSEGEVEPAWHSPVTESPRRRTSCLSSGEFIRLDGARETRGAAVQGEERETAPRGPIRTGLFRLWKDTLPRTSTSGA